MTKSIGRVIGILMLAVTTVLSHARADEVVVLKNQDFGPDKGFFESLIEKESKIIVEDEFIKIRDMLRFARVDLDGDGRHELIVMFESLAYCGGRGSEYSCLARIYVRASNETGWRRAGEFHVQEHLVEGEIQFAKKISDVRHNGWRAISSMEEEGSHLCWSNFAVTHDIWTHPEWFPGYYAWAPNDQPCPP